MEKKVGRILGDVSGDDDDDVDGVNRGLLLFSGNNG